MIYDFITPSDAITFVANDEKIAYMAAILLGNGKAGCHDETGKNLATMFLFHSNPVPVIEKELGDTMENYIDNHLQDLGECLLSFAYVRFEDREKYDRKITSFTDPDKLKEFKYKHEDKNRTSMSQWVKSAWNIGNGMLSKFEEKVK